MHLVRHERAAQVGWPAAALELTEDEGVGLWLWLGLGVGVVVGLGLAVRVGVAPDGGRRVD